MNVENIGDIGGSLLFWYDWRHIWYDPNYIWYDPNYIWYDPKAIWYDPKLPLKRGLHACLVC
jgi:hypothetical protein